jgi:hypothetical protein
MAGVQLSLLRCISLWQPRTLPLGHTHTHVHILMHARMHPPQTHTHTHIQEHIHTHKHIDKHTHTHTHTHIHSHMMHLHGCTSTLTDASAVVHWLQQSFTNMTLDWLFVPSVPRWLLYNQCNTIIHLVRGWWWDGYRWDGPIYKLLFFRCVA